MPRWKKNLIIINHFFCQLIFFILTTKESSDVAISVEPSQASSSTLWNEGIDSDNWPMHRIKIS